MSAFEYSNLSGRPPGRLVRIAGLVLPGVSRVQESVPSFAAAWGRDNRGALAADGPLWVALGDSLTLGIGAPAHDRGWVGQLRDRLGRRVVNLGVSGATTADVLERQLPALETLEPDLVTLMIGSNDLLRGDNRALLPERFAAVLDRLPRGAVVTTLPNPRRAARAANDLLLRVAPERGLVVAELRDPRLSSWRGRLAADHFHPNEAGYTAIADVLEPYVAEPPRD